MRVRRRLPTAIRKKRIVVSVAIHTSCDPGTVGEAVLKALEHYGVRGVMALSAEESGRTVGEPEGGEGTI